MRHEGGDMFSLDLGAMSDDKEAAARAAEPRTHDCSHPLTSHTGTEATWPYRVCAHVPCPCRILVD
jgi:hypothetical protein